MIRELMDELPGFATTGGQERFVLRHGISFGARPQDVVDEERKNGIRHRKEGMTDAEGMLFEAEEDFQLNYVYPKAAADLNLAGIPLYRFEYDFDRKEKRLYRFWYVFRLGEGSSPWFALSLALRKKYGDPVPDISAGQIGSVTWKNWKHNRLCWKLRDIGGRTVAVNLWNSEPGVCFLMYRRE